MYIVSRGKYSVFYRMKNLVSLVHVMEAEVTDAYNICIKLSRFLGPIPCLPVDNAARGVANAVALKLRTVYGLIVLVLRDPAHCLDLLPKNIATLDFVESILGDTKDLLDLLGRVCTTTQHNPSIRSYDVIKRLAHNQSCLSHLY